MKDKLGRMSVPFAFVDIGDFTSAKADPHGADALVESEMREGELPVALCDDGKWRDYPETMAMLKGVG